MLEECSTSPPTPPGNLVSTAATADLIASAVAENTAVLAFNVITLEHAEAIARGAERVACPAHPADQREHRPVPRWPSRRCSQRALRSPRRRPSRSPCTSTTSPSRADRCGDRMRGGFRRQLHHDRRRASRLSRQRRADRAVRRRRTAAGTVGGGRTGRGRRQGRRPAPAASAPTRRRPPTSRATPGRRPRGRRGSSHAMTTRDAAIDLDLTANSPQPCPFRWSCMADRAYRTSGSRGGARRPAQAQRRHRTEHRLHRRRPRRAGHAPRRRGPAALPRSRPGCHRRHRHPALPRRRPGRPGHERHHARRCPGSTGWPTPSAGTRPVRPSASTPSARRTPSSSRPPLPRPPTTTATCSIEATSNQVDQFGGYTGLRPPDFRDLVLRIADERGFPRDRIVLGGDHLGPNRWQREPPTRRWTRPTN